MPSEFFSIIFGGIGAGIIWLLKRGKAPYVDIFAEKSLMSDILGLAVLGLIVGVAFFINN